MKKLLVLLTMVPALASGQPDVCSMSSRTVTQGVSVLNKIKILDSSVWTQAYGWRECVSTVQAEHNDVEFVGTGRFAWADGRPASEACTMATQRAKDAIHEQIGSIQVASRKTLNCNDSPEVGTPRINTVYAVGYAGQLHEFPLYNHGRRPFSHQQYPGSTCLEFKHPSGRIGGIICQTTDNRWLVVDIKQSPRVQ
jgi:hypothetical protein